MRILILIDRDFAHRELTHVRMILIGLVDTGVMPIVALPEDMRHEFEQIPGATLLGYRDRGSVWTRTLRARELVDQIEPEQRKQLIVHSIGSRGFQFAAELSHLLGAPLVLDVHSRDAVNNAVGIINERSGYCIGIAPSPTLARAIIAAGAAPAVIREIPWGVMGGEVHGDDGQNETAGLILAGSGNDRTAWEAVIRALAQVASRREDFVILADADATERASISKIVSSLGLTPLFSRIPKLEADRDVVLRADLLLLPEAEGVTRSLVLDAMSTGMAVVTAEDRDVPALCDHTIARICSPEATEWAGAIESLLENRAEQRSLGTAARAYVSENHRPSKYISSLVDAYEWLVGNDSIPIASKES
ncbi:MAG: hypothetical protein Phyf2KO_05520 [Phycisphaerales bacterium]